MRTWAYSAFGLLATLAALGGCNTRTDSAHSQPAEAAASSQATPAASGAPQEPSRTSGAVASPAAPPHPPSGGALPSTRETAEATPNDIALVAKIEAAIAAETALHGSSIAVKAADGVVTLTGSTKDPGLRSMAAQVALSVPGVRSVRNELTISADV